MAAHKTHRKNFLRFLLSLGVAVATGALLCRLLAGPRLGAVYDVLLLYRPAPAVSRELVILEAGAGDSFLDPTAAARAALALTEFDAQALAVQPPVLGVSAGGDPGGEPPGRTSAGGGLREDELLSRFDEEFTLLARNIDNLFQAIRLGSVNPEEAEQYVGDLIGLSKQGKDRLLAALVREDGEGMRQWREAAAAFGAVWEAGGTGRYFRPQRDPDGTLRRVVLHPEDAGEREHPVYAMLSSRPEALPLDAQGALLLDSPRDIQDFTRLPLTVFSAYEQAGTELLKTLEAAEGRGYFAALDPERYPTLIRSYADSLLEDLLDRPGPTRRAQWREARALYVQSLEDFFNGPSEANLVDGYERFIALEEFETREFLDLIAQRDRVIRDFAELREAYHTFRELRARLAETLGNAFCILGSGEEVETAAVLANSILTGQGIIPLETQYILAWAFLAALITVFCIRRQRPLGTMILGLTLSLLAGSLCSLSFIFTSYWLDPLIPLGAALGGTLASACLALGEKRRAAAGFRRAYGAAIGAPYLKRVIRAGQPQPGETITAKAALVAVRQSELLTMEDSSAPPAGARQIRAFREEAARAFKKAGGALVGADGDLVLIAFGSPLERSGMARMKTEPPYEDDALAHSSHSPAAKAVGFILDLLAGLPETFPWRFGIDTGECAFTYSPLSGYGAFGHPVVRARILSSLTARYKARILVSAPVNEKLDGLLIRKLDTLTGLTGLRREAFYEILAQPAPKP
jgi:class 3 adenylate cyclase